MATFPALVSGLSRCRSGVPDSTLRQRKIRCAQAFATARRTAGPGSCVRVPS